jgi:hypothetical protein
MKSESYRGYRISYSKVAGDVLGVAKNRQRLYTVFSKTKMGASKALKGEISRIQKFVRRQRA